MSKTLNEREVKEKTPISSDRKRRETPIVTIHDLQMAKAVGDVSVVVGGLILGLMSSFFSTHK